MADPHAASACAVVDGVTFCSTVLPWRSCGPVPWGEGTHAERTARALDTLLGVLRRGGLMWGGDWNHSLFGAEWAGSKAGRADLECVLEELGLQVPTRDLSHRIDGVGSIDHIAVSQRATVVDAARVSGIGPDGALSDHDAYFVEIRRDRSAARRCEGSEAGRRAGSGSFRHGDPCLPDCVWVTAAMMDWYTGSAAPARGATGDF